MYLTALLLACTGPTDTTAQPSPSGGPGIVTAPLADTGFGAALAYGGGGLLWIGAPFGSEGITYSLTPDGSLTEVFRSAGKSGVALAASPTDGGVAIGAPLADAFAGAVYDADGAVLAGGASLGLALTWADGWVAAHGSGWRSADRSEETPARPSALAAMQRSDGGWQIGVGMAHGGKMLQVGETTLATPPRSPEAGYALASGDVDDDGEPEWVVGAPAADKIFIVSADGGEIEQTLTGEGRFGHALAVADVNEDGTADLVVGAPMHDGATGAVHLFYSGALDSPAVTWTSHRSGQLGFSVAARAGFLAAGAPGDPGDKGAVFVFVP